MSVFGSILAVQTRPASTLMVVKELVAPSLLVEIEAVAARLD